MRINAEKYDNWIKTHKKLIVVIWLAAFIVSIPFASHLFSVVSYNISGSSNSPTSGNQSNYASGQNSSLKPNASDNVSTSQHLGSNFNNLILLLIESNNVYSNSSKTFVLGLMQEFPKGNVTSIYGTELKLLNKSYLIISGMAHEAELAYAQKFGISGPLNRSELNAISEVIIQNFTGFLQGPAAAAMQAGPTLDTFITDIVFSYQNSSPLYVFNTYNFPDYPILPPQTILLPLVNGAHNVTLATVMPVNYQNASSFITSLAEKSGTNVYVAGFQALQNSIESNTLSGTFIAILVGLLLAIIVTGIIFKSPVAAIMPLIIFGINIVISYSIFYFIFHFILNTQISFFDPILTSILMLGLCTDYIIYILYRYRQERNEGKTQEKSASLAFGWAGGAVLVSGLTVISAYIVLSFLNLPFIGGSGILNAVGISVVLLSGLTLLPSLLHLNGDKLIFPYHITKRSTGSLFYKIGDFDIKNARVIISVFAVIAIIAFYVFMTANTDLNILGLLPNSSIKSAFYIATNNFGYDPIDPLALAFPNASNVTQISSIISGVRNIPGIYTVIPTFTGPQNYEIYLKYQAFSGSATETYNSLNTYLENAKIPYSLSGTSAFIADAYNAINSDVYPLIAILGTVIFIILFIILFSVFTPLRLVIMLISILMIANATTVLIFSVLLSLPFIAFAQVFLITNIMGVGVDYDIFLVMRIREHAIKGDTNTKAVKEGLARSGPVILSLGIILSSVFFGLAAAGIPLITEVGFIVGAGILIDTFVSVLIIIPSFMFLLSKFNWWPSRIGHVKRH